MTTTTKTKAWLRAIGSMRFGDLAIANLEELHGMLHDLIHIDDVDALRAALRDCDLGEASTLALDYQTERLRIAIERAERAEEELDTLRAQFLPAAPDAKP